jgi:flagellar biosynthesis GTPase FlhF
VPAPVLPISKPPIVPQHVSTLEPYPWTRSRLKRVKKAKTSYEKEAEKQPIPHPAPSQPERPQELTPPPQLAENRVPVDLVLVNPLKPEKGKLSKEDKARIHNEKRCARKEKERAKKELKDKEKAERKAAEKERRKAREEEKREKKAKKSRGHHEDTPLPAVQQHLLQEIEPQSTQDPPIEPDDGIGETNSKFLGGWQGLPTLGNLAGGIRKIIPKPASFSKSRKSSGAYENLCPAHQLQEDLEQLNKHLNQHLQNDEHRENQGERICHPIH